jgi:hypothetical protein
MDILPGFGQSGFFAARGRLSRLRQELELVHVTVRQPHRAGEARSYPGHTRQRVGSTEGTHLRDMTPPRSSPRQRAMEAALIDR